ncbi:hypothetical protein MMR14E_18975 [Methylobacterium mesophilicum]
MRQRPNVREHFRRGNALSRTIWQAHAAETVTDSEAQGLAEALHTRRAAIREAWRPSASRSAE